MRRAADDRAHQIEGENHRYSVQMPISAEVQIWMTLSHPEAWRSVGMPWVSTTSCRFFNHRFDDASSERRFYFCSLPVFLESLFSRSGGRTSLHIRQTVQSSASFSGPVPS